MACCYCSCFRLFFLLLFLLALGVCALAAVVIPVEGIDCIFVVLYSLFFKISASHFLLLGMCVSVCAFFSVRTQHSLTLPHLNYANSQESGVGVNLTRCARISM